MKLFSFKLPLRAGFFAPDGTPALSLSSADDTLTVRLWTTYAPSPLTLTAPFSGYAEGGLLIHPWRIELWVDGNLYDEEWPAGTFYLDALTQEELNEKGISVFTDPEAGDDANVPLRAAGWHTDCGISANETAPEITGTLTSADGDNPAEGVNLDTLTPITAEKPLTGTLDKNIYFSKII